MQHDWVLMTEKCGHRDGHAQREGDVRTEGEVALGSE